MGKHAKEEPKKKISLPRVGFDRNTFRKLKERMMAGEESYDEENPEEFDYESEDARVGIVYEADPAQAGTEEAPYAPEEAYEDSDLTGYAYGEREVYKDPDEEGAHAKKRRISSVNVRLPKVNLQVSDNMRSLSANSSLTIGRLVIGILILVLIRLSTFGAFLNTLLLILAFVAVGFKVGLNLINDIADNHYMTIHMILTLIVVASFFMGFAVETLIMLMVYELFDQLIPFVLEKIVETSLSTAVEQDPARAAKLREIVDNNGHRLPDFEGTIIDAANGVLLFAGIFALMYAIALPFFTNYTYSDSFHRAFMALVICTPVSLVAALPAVGINALVFGASRGFIFKQIDTVFLASDATSVIMDKNGVVSTSGSQLVSLEPVHIDQITYLAFAAHAALESEQPQFHLLTGFYGSDFHPEFISDFKDILGFGVTLMIQDKEVVLGTSDMFTTSDIIFKPYSKGKMYYYMTIDGNYVGCIGFTYGVSESSASMIGDLKDEGIEYMLLLSEEGEENNDMVAEYADFNKVYHGLSTETKLGIIRDFKDTSEDKTLFFYANGVEGHSSADVDIRVSTKGKYADILLYPDCVGNAAGIMNLSRRVRRYLTIAISAAFAIKGILIVLALTGNCTLWFAVLLDSIAALAAMIFSTRVAGISKPKRIHEE